MQLKHILRKCTAGYKLSESQEKINPQIYAVRIYSLDIGMEFGIEKCAMLVMKNDERHLTDGMKPPNQDKIRKLGEKEIYKYLSILEADNIKKSR